MTYKVILPKSGMGIEEGTIVRWLKSSGDSVAKGEPIAEIETAKAIEELPAPVSGILTRILVEPGQVTAVNTAIAIIE